MRFYLSGSIEYSPDFGKGWRAAVTPVLLELGHAVYDPAEDETKNLEEHEVSHFRSWKTTDLPRFQSVLRKIIAYDLDIVEQESDAVIVLWDEAATRGAGTHGEVTVAHRRNIPVYLVAGMPVGQISGWILGCSTQVFNSLDELLHFLRREHGAHASPALAPAQPLRTAAATRPE